MSHPLYAAPKKRDNRPVPHTFYQVDYVAVNCGKIVAASKRRIRFKFGYTNLEALEAGKTGQDCRGSEHEIVITWSLSSGKQAIAFDQQEVYFDVGDSTQTKIAHAFKDQLGHMIEVKVHAANMSTKTNPDPDWKQYDILVDGVSFFRMPKIFEIGIYAPPEEQNYRAFPYPSANSSPNGSPQGYRNNMGSILPPEDSPKTVEPEPPVVADLLSFDDFDVPPAQVAPTQAAPQASNYAPPPAMPPAQVPQASYAPPTQPPTQATQAYAPPAQQPQAYAAPVPTQVEQNYSAPPPAANQQYSAQTNPFESTQAQAQVVPSTPAPVNNYAEPSFVAPTPTAAYAQQPQPNPVTPPTASNALVPAETVPTANYGVDGGVKNLVNLDDLFGNATAVTKESVDAKMQEANAHKSLGQLQGSCNAAAAAKKPVMNTFNPAPPAYQQQPQQMYNNGFAPQQQQYQQQSYAQPGYGY